MPCHAGDLSGTSRTWLTRDDDAGFQQLLERADYRRRRVPKLTAPVSATLAAVVLSPTDDLSDLSVMTCSQRPHDFPF